MRQAHAARRRPGAIAERTDSGAGEADPDRLDALRRGEKGAWDGFVSRYAGLVAATARRALGRGRMDHLEADAVQETFVRLCRNDFALLRRYDPARAKLSTWLAVIAYSAAIDLVRKERPAVPLDEVPEAALSHSDEPPERIEIPPGLLPPRQQLVMRLIYERDMDVAEVAVHLGIEAQTVRSLRHKALAKLRGHFAEES